MVKEWFYLDFVVIEWDLIILYFIYNGIVIKVIKNGYFFEFLL